jgi:excinuclease UvrABC nuclease subunit
MKDWVLENPVSIGDILKPGVYQLLHYGKIVFIGKSKCLLVTLAAHRAANTGPRLPEWFPIKRIQFDDVQIIACATDRAALLLPALIALYKPRHNIHNKPVTPLPTFPVPEVDRPAARITRRI